jgi:hypothetical protein
VTFNPGVREGRETTGRNPTQLEQAESIETNVAFMSAPNYDATARKQMRFQSRSRSKGRKRPEA